ncbi:drug/metabolite transporter (DMT) superfamily [Athalassotoga saccharophila]|nr:drug/metabolite transporter (DMT) superfamily [Athalassotoga saccharophila]
MGGLRIEKNSQSKFLPLLLLSLLVVVWGTTFPIEKIMLETLSPFSLNLFRFLIADAVMLIIFFPSIKRDFLSVWQSGLLLGITMGAGFVFQTWGLVYTTPAKSGFITSMYVVFAPILSFIFEKTKVSVHTILALIIATSGIYLTELSGRIFEMNFGDFLTFLCAVAFAFQVLLMTVLTKKHEGKEITLTFYQFLVITVFNLPFYIFSGHNDNWNLPDVIFILYMAIVASIIGIIIQAKYQKRIGTVSSSFIYAGEPVMATVFSVLILKSTFSQTEIIGFAMITFAAIWAQLFNFSSSRKEL